MSNVSPSRRTSKGPYRPTRDPQVLLLVGIVVAVVGMWAVGVMSPATLAGGESGPIFPFSDQSEDGRVGIELNRSTVDPGESIEVTVTVDGKATSGAAVSVADETYETGADGTAIVRLASPGSYEVRATRPDGNRSTTASVTVRRYETELAVSAPSGAVTNETVPVTVERVDGGPVDATVSVAGETVRTGPDGVANVSFETAGEYAVSASKDPTEAYRFVDASTTVSIDRRPVALVVSTNASEPHVDEQMAVTVERRDTGAAVNATVSARNRTVATGPDGTATFAFETAGSVAFRADANRTPAVRFVTGETSVDVQRIPVNLTVSTEPIPIVEGERGTFVVRRADSGERVQATLELFGSTYATGADGRVSFPFYVPGNRTVTATKAATPRERFVPASSSFVVEGPEVVAESISVPESAPANATMQVTATLSNVGNVDAGEDAVVTVGDVTTSIPTTVEHGTTTTVSWTVRTPNATGNATVHVEYEEVSVERTVTLERDEANATARTRSTRVGEATTTHDSRASRHQITRSEPGGAPGSARFVASSMAPPRSSSVHERL